MAGATTTTSQPVRYMQGIAVPAESVQPEEFFARTRRHTALEKQITYTGQPTDIIELRKSDILSNLIIRFSGSIAIALNGGTAATTARWPYDFLKAVRFTANGASNIINCSGLKLKVRDLMKNTDLNDRGIVQTVAGVQRSQGTLALATESWGVGSNTTGLASGTYAVDLEWTVPVAEDNGDLLGAIFLATSSSDLTLSIDYELPANLFVLAGGATATLTGFTQVTSEKFSIPIGSQGGIVIPDLSVFHSMIQSRTAGSIANGDNEFRIVGQGAGKSLERLFYQVFNGAGTAAAPLAMTTANFGRQSWRYGNNETPDEFIDGTYLRVDMERRYSTDIGGVWGFGCHDFVNENSFRDVVDMGTAAELRFMSNIQSTVVLNSPAVEYVTETVFLAGQSA